MMVRIWRLATIMLAALDMGMAWCHVLELPAKMRYDGPQWTRVQQTLYRSFGTEGVGAWIEPGAVLAAVVLAFLVRSRRPASGLTLAGTGFLAAALGAWFAFVAPMNAEVATWTPETVPPEWTRTRNQWEYAHAARFVLQLVGFGALLASVCAPLD
jgi:hypothetical protein